MAEHIVEGRVRAVESRFELAAPRIIERWLAVGAVAVSPADLRVAQEFLEQAGWKVQRSFGGLVRVTNRQGHAQEMSREDVVLMAIRRLAKR